MEACVFIIYQPQGQGKAPGPVEYKVSAKQDMRLRSTPLPLAVAARAAPTVVGERGVSGGLCRKAARRSRIQGGYIPPGVI